MPFKREDFRFGRVEGPPEKLKILFKQYFFVPQGREYQQLQRLIQAIQLRLIEKGCWSELNDAKRYCCYVRLKNTDNIYRIETEQAIDENNRIKCILHFIAPDTKPDDVHVITIDLHKK